MPGERLLEIHLQVKTLDETLNKLLVTAAFGPAAFSINNPVFAKDRNTFFRVTVEKGKAYIIDISDKSVTSSRVELGLKEYVPPAEPTY